MFKWQKAKKASSEQPSSQSLDFTDPNAEKFESSLSEWRKSLEAKKTQDSRLNQSDLNYLSTQTLSDLEEKQRQAKKAATAKKRAATLKAKQKAGDAAAKSTKASPEKKAPSVKPAPKKAAAKPASSKPSAKTTAAKKTTKPAASKASPKKKAAHAAKKVAPPKKG